MKDITNNKPCLTDNRRLAIDIGNVLCLSDFTMFLYDISKTFNISSSDAKYFLNRTQKLNDLGATTMAEELKDTFDIKSEAILNELLESWNKSIVFNSNMLMMIEKIINNGVKVALLSNMGIEHLSFVLSNQIKAFDQEENILKKCIPHFSCEVGARKPTYLFYQSFIMNNPDFKGCLYIDDLDDNLNSAKNFGFNSFKFNLNESYDIRSIENLEKLIISQ